MAAEITRLIPIQRYWRGASGHKGFRRIFSRFEKLDVMFVAFINFAFIVDGLR
jgi:hypothetical protein